jgi:TatA/E family protein of Tat protein translocase
MFGSLGFPELLMIFVVALIVFGPRKLPEIGRTLGKALGEFKKATDELKNTIEKEVQVEELKEFRNLSPTNLFNTAVSRTEPVAPAVKPPRWAAHPAGSEGTDPSFASQPEDPSFASQPVEMPAAPVHLADSASAHPTPKSEAAPASTLAETGTPGRAE